MKRLIFGCGYLGLPTAKRWVAAGDQVWAVTRGSGRISELLAAGVEPLLGDVTQPDTLPELPAVDSVLFAIGMDRSKYSDIRMVYVDGLQHVLERLPAATGQLIYVSSTGVYGDSAGQWLDENSEARPNRAGGHACLEAESLIRNSQFANRATILRFAGIYGGDRIPFRHAIENRDWSQLSGNGFLNLIHVADGARIIQSVAEQKLFGETFLVSDGNPVLRKDFYDALAAGLGTGPIPWLDFVTEAEAATRNRGDKRISNLKLRQRVGDDFLVPDYLAGLRATLNPD